ncbi:hypothetical protein FKW77_008524 [Venturia effusa]|uniref:Carboxypeptidase Y inhibitor n=1 Tax=Venturia effusa TaxID=50376 RepID=A0A517LBE7_9PEZI|nr:hypothetical protein FKW77_008524 [Venturia effusa]
MIQLLRFPLLAAGLLGQLINALLTDQVVFNSDSTNHLKVRQKILRLLDAEIIPTVIDDFVPALTLIVSWPNKTAKLGNTIKPDQLQDAPTVKLHGTHRIEWSGVQYTIALTDPDAPSRDNPKWSEMCHWIATNIPVTSLAVNTEGSVSMNMKEIMPYKPLGPPPKTGKHRYVFLAFARTTKEPKLSKPKDRQHWGTGKKKHGVRDWAAENGLTPVAANFIYSQNEEQ